MAENSNYQAGSHNTIGGHSGQIGGHFPVWQRTYHKLQGGIKIDVEALHLKAGDVIGEGTQVIWNGPGKVGQIVPANASEDLQNKVNGFLEFEICIPSNCKLATGAVVTSGRMYCDRVALGISEIVKNRFVGSVEFVPESFDVDTDEDE